MEILKKASMLLTVFLLSVFPAAAFSSATYEAAVSIADNSPYLYAEATQLEGRGLNSKEDFKTTLTNTIKETFRNVCLAKTFYYEWTTTSDGVTTYCITYDELEPIIEELVFLDSWTNQNLPLIVPDGTDKETAIRLIFDWICDNAEYDYSVLNGTASPDTMADSQYASTILKTGYAVCGGYARLFRAMVEALPMNGNYVDYINGTDTIKVAFVRSETAEGIHAWNAIYDNGIWYHYDTTSADTGSVKNREPFYKKTAEEIVINQLHGAKVDELTWEY